jgi:hypothetical protein
MLARAVKASSLTLLSDFASPLCFPISRCPFGKLVFGEKAEALVTGEEVFSCVYVCQVLLKHEVADYFLGNVGSWVDGLVEISIC